MSMIKRAVVSGKIEQFTGENNDGSIVCQSCDRIIVSRVNVAEDGTCPFCHRNVNSSISVDPLDDDETDIIAQSC